MNLAYMYATPEISHNNVTAIQGEMTEKLTKIKSIGYTGVELLVRDPRQIDQRKLEMLVENLELDIPAICTGEVYGEDLVSFADRNKEIRLEAISRMKSCLQLAKRFKSMVNVGRLRGRYVNEVQKEVTESYVKEAIIECADAYPDVPILMEPVNHHYANYLLTTEEMLDFIQDVNRKNVGLMLDLEHILMEGEIPSEVIQDSKQYLWHFHVCDSNRMPPGLGEYDFDILFNILRRSGYDRYVTVECFQRPNTSLAIESSYRTLSKHFRKG